jgi:hypothetical protein
MAQDKYDEALFVQLLRQKGGSITDADIEAAFWRVAWDLDVAIQQQKPEMMEPARETFRKMYLPIFRRQLKEQGFIVEDAS